MNSGKEAEPPKIKKELFYKQPMINPLMPSEEISREAIVEEWDKLMNELSSREFEYELKGERIPGMKKLLSKDEFNKYRRLKRRLDYYKELGSIEMF